MKAELVTAGPAGELGASSGDADAAEGAEVKDAEIVTGPEPEGSVTAPDAENGGSTS